MVARGTATIRYDAERRPVRVNDGAAVLWRASYDGDGARRKRLDTKGTIHYLSGYERNVGNGADTTEVITKYYRALGRLIAIRKNGTLYWIGSDHLGGTIRVADSGFSPVNQMRYTPYGVSRDDAGALPLDYLFTDQQLDGSIGLYWYGSRAYDAAMGRFVCADTIVPSAGNPQSLNRYSYAYNNPLKFTDPTGHFAIVIPAAAYGIAVTAAAAAAFQTWWSMPDNPARVGVTQALTDLAVAVGDIVQDMGNTTMEGRYRVHGKAVIVRRYGDHPGSQRYRGDIVGGRPNEWVDVETGEVAANGKWTGEKWSEKDLDELHRQMEKDGLWPRPQDPSPETDATGGIEFRMSLYASLDNGYTPRVSTLGSTGIGISIPIPGDLQSLWGTGTLDVLVTAEGSVSASISAHTAPGGAGVTNITASNPSGDPSDGRGWDTQDRASREAAWIRGGCWGRNDDGTLFQGTP
jgi:RHS repeat-associated protein